MPRSAAISLADLCCSQCRRHSFSRSVSLPSLSSFSMNGGIRPVCAERKYGTMVLRAERLNSRRFPSVPYVRGEYCRGQKRTGSRSPPLQPFDGIRHRNSIAATRRAAPLPALDNPAAQHQPHDGDREYDQAEVASAVRARQRAEADADHGDRQHQPVAPAEEGDRGGDGQHQGDEADEDGCEFQHVSYIDNTAAKCKTIQFCVQRRAIGRGQVDTTAQTGLNKHKPWTNGRTLR